MYGVREVIVSEIKISIDFINNSIIIINDNKYYSTSFTSEQRQFVEWILDPPYNMVIKIYRHRNDQICTYGILIKHHLTDIAFFELE
jgi:hypothetical protein